MDRTCICSRHCKNWKDPHMLSNSIHHFSIHTFIYIYIYISNGQMLVEKEIFCLPQQNSIFLRLALGHTVLISHSTSYSRILDSPMQFMWDGPWSFSNVASELHFTLPGCFKKNVRVCVYFPQNITRLGIKPYFKTCFDVLFSYLTILNTEWLSVGWFDPDTPTYPVWWFQDLHQSMCANFFAEHA